MPTCFQNCYSRLTAGGMPPRKASRAAHFAFWQVHKQTPAAADREGRQCSCDLTPLAATISQTLAAQALEVVELEAAQPIAEGLTHFADLTIDPPSEGISHVLREVRVIRPGVYRGHEWTLEDLREIEAAFDPSEPPPIQMQHARSPGDRYGRVRALRLREDGWLWALCEFIGQRATEAVLTRLWSQTSAGLVIAPYQALEELSIVDAGAVPGSSIQHEEDPSRAAHLQRPQVDQGFTPEQRAELARLQVEYEAWQASQQADERTFQRLTGRLKPTEPPLTGRDATQHELTQLAAGKSWSTMTPAERARLAELTAQTKAPAPTAAEQARDAVQYARLAKSMGLPYTEPSAAVVALARTLQAAPDTSAQDEASYQRLRGAGCR